MARTRKIIPDIVGINMVELASILLKMSDAEIGAWFRKAVVDCVNGCKDPNCDPFIKVQYENTIAAIRSKQDYDARRYQQRKALGSGKPDCTISTNDQETPSAGGSCVTFSMDASTRKGKSITASINDQVPAEVSTTTCNTPTTASATVGSKTDKFNGDAATSDGAEAVSRRESGIAQLTTISNISQDAPNGNAGDANLVHPAPPIAESARCATSEAVKALADGDFREDSLNVPDGSDAAQTESSTSAKILKLKTEGRQSQLTGGTPERCKRSTASHAEKLPVSTPADSSEEKKPYGTCKHVMLTDAEGRHLREVYGNNLSVAIDILDAYIENGGKAAKKYKNHAAVLRKGNWVYEKVQTMALNEKRIENASKGLKNWKAEERERTARVLRGESADGKNYVRDEELTPAELEAKYA